MGLKVDHRVIVEWVVVGQTIGFIGSLIGGWYAADRKKEVESLNVRLVAVNKQLREQARAAQAGAYSPDAVAAANGNGGSKKAPNPGNSLAVADDSSPAAQEIIATLRTGKSALKSRDGAGARPHFERALALVRDPTCGLETPWKAERKALRGLGAAAQLQKQYDAALTHMMQVLDISEKHGDTSGQADAIGVIADIHTEAGDLEKAGQWYDRYISAMQ
jgi:tetratricopeptide (TPR) repeat protein